MPFGYVRGALINTKGTVFSVTLDIDGSNTVPTGFISGIIQFFTGDTIKKFKFSSAAPVNIKALEWKTIPYVEASFDDVVLEDLTDGSRHTGHKAEMSAARIDSGNWHGSFSVKTGQLSKIKVSGQFAGVVKVAGRPLEADAVSTLAAPTKKTRKLPVIVQLRQGGPEAGPKPKSVNEAMGLSPQELREAIGLKVKEISQAMGLRVKHRFHIIDAFSANVTSEQLHTLMENPAVKAIVRDKINRINLNVAKNVVKAPKVWNLGYLGKGIGIAVLDSGVFPHPDLTTPKNRIIAFKDFVNKRIKPYDDNGHGTHVAGDAAGNGNSSGGRYQGPAPEANIIGIKVIDKNGAGSDSVVIAGVQWAIQNRKRYNIRVLNLSIGAAATLPAKYDPLCQALERAWQTGIVVCVSAGNSGPWPFTITNPGIDPLVITVGNENDKRTVTIKDDSIDQSSSRGPTIDSVMKPDVVAPGDNIISLRAPGSALDKAYPNNRVGKWYFQLSGSSMASPICAGSAALLIQKRPSITPDKVKHALKSTARLIDAAPDIAQGKGLINDLAAVKKA